MNKYAVIVAGGSGTRMGTETPKQFLTLGNAPILMHTIKRFFAADANIIIVLVLPEEQVERWHQLCMQHNFSIPHHIVFGGKTRFQSVRNGLNCIGENEGLVAIHDGVRPFLSKQIIENGFETANEKGNAITAVDSKDSIRVANKAINRSEVKIVQTPQCFKLSLIREAFLKAPHELFTDDASIVEAIGQEIHLIDGSYQNIKITTPEDMAMAEAILQNFNY